MVFATPTIKGATISNGRACWHLDVAKAHSTHTSSSPPRSTATSWAARRERRGRDGGQCAEGLRARARQRRPRRWPGQARSRTSRAESMQGQRTPVAAGRGRYRNRAAPVEAHVHEASWTRSLARVAARDPRAARKRARRAGPAGLARTARHAAALLLPDARQRLYQRSGSRERSRRGHHRRRTQPLRRRRHDDLRLRARCQDRRADPAAGPLGCLSSSAGTGCGHALGLSGVAQIGLSPDGRHLYAVSSISGSVTAFARDVTTGALTQLRGAAGCVRPGGLGGCASGIGLAGATALAIAPDGRSLYVAGHDANAVASFSIDPVGGALLQLGGKGRLRARRRQRGRVHRRPRTRSAPTRSRSRRTERPSTRRPRTSTQSRSCSAIRPRCALAAARADRVHPPQRRPRLRHGARLGAALGARSRPGGRDLYVASASGNAIALLQRDAATGLLIQPAGRPGCIGQGIADCSAAPLLTAPTRSRSGPTRPASRSPPQATARSSRCIATRRAACSRPLPRPRAASRRPPPAAVRPPAAGPATSLAIAPTATALRGREHRADRAGPPGSARLPEGRAARRRRRADAGPAALHRPERGRADLRDRLEGHPRRPDRDQGRIHHIQAQAGGSRRGCVRRSASATAPARPDRNGDCARDARRHRAGGARPPARSRSRPELHTPRSAATPAPRAAAPVSRSCAWAARVGRS